MTTNGDILRRQADAKDIPLRTVDDVRATIEEAKRCKSDTIMARLLLKHGRLTDEARAFLTTAYPQH